MFIPCKKPRSSSPALASSGLYHDYEVHIDDMGFPGDCTIFRSNSSHSLSYPVEMAEGATAVAEASVLASAIIRSTPFNCSSLWRCTDDL